VTIVKEERVEDYETPALDWQAWDEAVRKNRDPNEQAG
jgi:hypothetical protein